MTNKYESPLSSRYASDYMLNLFSSDTRYQTWRKLWVSLAKAEMELGLPITQSQVDELNAHITDIDYDVVSRREKEVRHDVMAHVYAYGQVAPSAAGIIHLGATSCYVTDNADLIIYRDALRYLRGELLGVLANLSEFAEKYKSMPTLGYTHYQPAQLVTVGKRATLWMQNFLSDLKEIDFAIENIKFLGCRGTTGTEASFVELFEGDGAKIEEMNRKIADDFGFDECFDVCGQTYPRKLDSRILNALSSIAQSCYNMANDIRLLQHDRQLEEPFEKNQIGSSAMAYKRNPMRSERICSLAQNITDGLHVNEKIVESTVREYLPFIATENLMMEAVKKGGNRQEIHEIIRKNSMEATAKMKNGEKCDLTARLANDPAFGMTEEEIDALLLPEKYIGRCPEQVTKFVAKIKPLLEGITTKSAEINL